jgi:DNA-directed RNA polymerase specialized sigma24 family protein
MGVVDPSRGRFRSFLLTVLKNFVANEREKAESQKRGGGILLLPIEVTIGESRYAREPAIDLTPEKLYERQWAVTLLDHVMAKLRREFVLAGKEEQFDCLKGYLAGPSEASAYADATARLGMSRAAAMMAVSRLRRRYRKLLRSEIARTLTHPEEVEDEIGRLFDALDG